MVAPTGVNEGLPQEPAKAGQGGAELAQPAATEAKPGETAPAGAGENAGPAEAEPEVSGLAEAEPELAEAGSAEAEPAEAGEPPGAEWDAEERRRDISPLAVVGIILGVIA